MFRKADDPKSSLILPALAWTDFLRPKLCIFENVRGFLRYNIGARQAGKHRVEGGIEMGGLKLILHALISMEYDLHVIFKELGLTFFQLSSSLWRPAGRTLWHPANTHSVLSHSCGIGMSTARTTST